MKRRARGAWALACGIWLSPAVAGALTEGGAFAGAARASGATTFYNTAAVAADPPWSAMAEFTGLLLAGISYERDGTDPNTQKPYAPVSFTAIVPDFAFTLTAPSPFPWLRFAAGGFSPFANGARWPEDGPQRHFATDATVATYTVLTGLVVEPLPQVAVSLMVGPTYGWLEQHNAVDFGAFANAQLPAGSDLFELEDPALEGRSTVRAAGWTVTSQFGVWTRPLAWLTFGGSLTLPRSILMQGSLHTESAELLGRALPAFDLAPEARVNVRYPMPWTVQSELEAKLGEVRLSFYVEYIRRRVQKAIYAQLSEAEPDFVEGQTVSLKGAHDDWAVGARMAQALTDTLEVAARVDIHPRYLPSETVSPGNLDFTTLYLGAGARWQVTSSLAFSLSYAFVYLVPFTVNNSVFNPRAPQESGLSSPAANGRYSGSAHTLVIGAEMKMPAPGGA